MSSREETTRAIDAEVRAILIQAHQTDVNILSDRREALGQIAGVLLQKEVIEGQELKDLLKQHKAA